MKYSGVACIEWIDSSEYEDADWKSEDEVKELTPMRIKSVGILVNEDDLYITLASSVNNYDLDCEAQFGGLITIPKVAILKQWTFPKSFLSEAWPGPGV